MPSPTPTPFQFQDNIFAAKQYIAATIVCRLWYSTGQAEQQITLSSSKDSKMERFPKFLAPTHQKFYIAYNTAPGDPAAKLCGNLRSSLVEKQSTNKNRVLSSS